MSKSEYKSVIVVVVVVVVVPDPELCVSSCYCNYQCKASRGGGQGYTVELNLNYRISTNGPVPWIRYKNLMLGEEIFKYLLPWGRKII